MLPAVSGEQAPDFSRVVILGIYAFRRIGTSRELGAPPRTSYLCMFDYLYQASISRLLDQTLRPAMALALFEQLGGFHYK